MRLTRDHHEVVSTTRRRGESIGPAGVRAAARLIVSKIVLDMLEGLKLTYPETSTKRRGDLLAIRKQLAR